jgi:hypothetical protein
MIGISDGTVKKYASALKNSYAEVIVSDKLKGYVHILSDKVKRYVHISSP